MQTSDRFRLDRSAFRVGKAGDAALQEANYAALDWRERIRISQYLIAAAWGFPAGKFPKMDKTICTCRKRS